MHNLIYLVLKICVYIFSKQTLYMVYHNYIFEMYAAPFKKKAK